MAAVNPRTIDLNLLTVFVLLWDTRSVSRASEKLYLSQSAVSHALKRLRETLDDPLFLATRSGLVPTNVASELIIPIRESLESIQKAIGRIEHFDPRSSRREFRIACPDIIEFWLFPELVEKLQTEAPGVIIDGINVPDSKAAEGMLEAGDIDLIIDIQKPSATFISSVELLALRIVTMIRAEDQLEGGKLSLDTYLERPHVVYQLRNRDTNAVDKALTALGLSRRVSVVANNFLTMASIAARTGYVMNVPDRAAPLFEEIFGLTKYDPPIELDVTPLYCSHHLKFEADLGLRWLRANISESLRT